MLAISITGNKFSFLYILPSASGHQLQLLQQADVGGESVQRVGTDPSFSPSTFRTQISSRHPLQLLQQAEVGGEGVQRVGTDPNFPPSAFRTQIPSGHQLQLLQQAEVGGEGGQRVGADHAAGSRGRHADARHTRVAAPGRNQQGGTDLAAAAAPVPAAGSRDDGMHESLHQAGMNLGEDRGWRWRPAAAGWQQCNRVRGNSVGGGSSSTSSSSTPAPPHHTPHHHTHTHRPNTPIHPHGAAALTCTAPARGSAAPGSCPPAR
jgi:hypothetical protein